MKAALIMFLTAFYGLNVLGSQNVQAPVFDGGWEFQTVTSETRAFFGMPQRVIGVFNNNHQLPGQNSTVLMQAPRALTWKEATFSIVNRIKRTSKKLMIKSSSYRLSGGEGNIFVSEYLWTPVEKSQVVAIIHIKKADASYLLLTDLEDADYKAKKTVIQGLALEIYRRQKLVFPQN